MGSVRNQDECPSLGPEGGKVWLRKSQADAERERVSPPEQPVWSRLLSQGTLPDSLVDSSQAWHELTVTHKGTPFSILLLNLADDIKEQVLSWCQNVFNSSPAIANLPFYQREQALSSESLDGNSIQVKFLI